MTTLPVADARARLSQLVQHASATHERFEITRNGVRTAVLLGADDYDSILETISILSDAETVKAIEAGVREIEQGQTFNAEEVREAMSAAGRLR